MPLLHFLYLRLRHTTRHCCRRHYAVLPFTIFRYATRLCYAFIYTALRYDTRMLPLRAAAYGVVDRGAKDMPTAICCCCCCRERCLAPRYDDAYIIFAA